MDRGSATAIILEEAQRLVTVREGNILSEIPTQQAVIKLEPERDGGRPAGAETLYTLGGRGPTRAGIGIIEERTLVLELAQIVEGDSALI